MEEAYRLLKATSVPIGEIAGQLGFEGIHYFSRRFKEYYKLPPRSVRADR
jgi:AraC-like DNA-binding protein